MARPGLIEHRKFRRFCALLGEPEAHALGLLEFIWRVAYETASPYLGDAVDVEAAARWTGEPGRCLRALAGAGGCDARDAGDAGAGGAGAGRARPGFIEPVEGMPGHWQVHDLEDHAPDYVRKRLRRETARRSEVRALSGKREAGRFGADSAPREKGTDDTPTGQRPVSDRSESAFRAVQSSSEQSSRKSVGADSVLVMPCKAGRRTRSSEWPLESALVRELEESFPGVDVVVELRKAKGWLETNPQKRKTFDGMSRFCWRWLSRANDSGHFAQKVVGGASRFGGNGSGGGEAEGFHNGRRLGTKTDDGKFEWTLSGWQEAKKPEGAA